ncbi:MAG: hypothetical protein RMX96_33695 [Nostoc sp. ChiSLP02]|nr:hypothetical protein [Nostoc sp. DedSLP05]MDZ8101530.1 hypothetical protein [Nostoc sp. DedSLP01]MDZ8189777.1 hypothetical protein [Nostoc sp. ChiSLP02]
MNLVGKVGIDTQYFLQAIAPTYLSQSPATPAPSSPASHMTALPKIHYHDCGATGGQAHGLLGISMLTQARPLAKD